MMNLTSKTLAIMEAQYAGLELIKTTDPSETPFEQSLQNAGVVGSVALLLLRTDLPNVDTVRHFTPQELMSEDFPIFPSTLDNYKGQLMTHRNTSVALKRVNFNTGIVNRRSGSRLSILSMTVPRDQAAAEHYTNLPPSSRPNTDLFMRSMHGAAYPMRRGDDLNAYNRGLRYMAPFLQTVIDRIRA
jgi:hypothetical protein